MSKHRIMYAVYPSRHPRNIPMAMFDAKYHATEWMQARCPGWMTGKYRVERVWVDRKNMMVFTISEHNGYRSRGFKEKLLGRPT